jgi:cobalamin biosynthesis Co2+ chelatase CbiK
MTKPNRTAEDFDAFDCSSAFTYDEIIDILRDKQQYFEAKWKRANSDSADMLMGMSAACGFLISDFASRASDKQKKRLAQKGFLEQTHYSDDSLRPGPQGQI